VAITNGYCSLNELKSAFRIEISDTIDDSLLELCIESASREIDGACERVFYSTAGATRVYVPRDSFLVETDDIVSVTTLKTSSGGVNFDITWTTGDYQLEPLNGLAGGIATPYTQIRAIGDYLFPVWEPSNVNAQEATVQITGTFGFSAVPTAIKQATIIQAQRLFKRYDSPMGIMGFSDLGAVRVGRIDPDVMELISPWRKVRFA
jgi:hypothetical protein